MSVKPRIVAALVRLYPASWRREYGAELNDLLMARPLSAWVVGDVLWSGLRQRVRTAEPSTLVGLAMMLAILAALVRNIAGAPPGGRLTPLLEDSSMTLPTVVVKPLMTEFYVLLLVGCGCWTQLRHRGTASQSGKAAAKVTLIAGAPIILAGLLMSAGMLDVRVLGSGFAPTPLGVLFAPLSRLPESWIWGAVGAQLGRRISRLRHNPAAGS
jgi:hypothetical protein